VSAVVDFLRGQGVDGHGRTVEAILAFDAATLEQRHDFIQWLSPTGGQHRRADQLRGAELLETRLNVRRGSGASRSAR
jgi:hypothetical protein